MDATAAPLPVAPESPFRRELSAVVRLALPVAGGQIGLMLMGVVDTLMLGHYSAAALAGSSVGHITTGVLLMFGWGVLSALDPLVAQAHGAGDRAAVAGHFVRGAVLACLLSVPIGLAMWELRPLFRLFGLPADVVANGGVFTRGLVWGVLPYLLTIALRQTLQAMSIVRPALLAIVAGNVVNLAANWLLIFGHLGFPRLGVQGSAFSTSTARWVMFLALVVAARRPLADLLRTRPEGSVKAWVPYRLLLRIGVPIGAHTVLELLLFAVIALLMGRLGTEILAGHQIAINLASLTFMVPMGIAGAAATRVGNAIGRGDPSGARRSAGVCYALGTGVMLVSALLFALFPRALAGLYTTDPAVLAAAAMLLPIAAAFQIFDGAQVVSTGILRGTADTVFPAALALVGFWLIGLPASWFLAFPAGYGAAGLWWGVTLGLAAVAILLGLRILRRFRGTWERIEG